MVGAEQECPIPYNEILIQGYAAYRDFLLAAARRGLLSTFIDHSRGQTELGQEGFVFPEDLTIIDFGNPTPGQSLLYQYSLLAASCEACAGLLLPADQSPEVMTACIKAFFRDLDSGAGHLNRRQRNYLVNALLMADAVRIMHLLRNGGFITTPIGQVRQISLGAHLGLAERVLHYTPLITTNPEFGKLMLETVANAPKQLVLIDNYGGLRLRWEYLRLGRLRKALGIDAVGIVSDVSKALSGKIPERLCNANLVTMLRLDPAMMPDVAKFLQLIAGVIDPEADLVVTIGIGDQQNLGENAWRQRQQKMVELQQHLLACRMLPRRILLTNPSTRGKNPPELLLGHPAYGICEVLYCRLNREALR